MPLWITQDFKNSGNLPELFGDNLADSLPNSYPSEAVRAAIPVQAVGILVALGGRLEVAHDIVIADVFKRQAWAIILRDPVDTGWQILALLASGIFGFVILNPDEVEVCAVIPNRVRTRTHLAGFRSKADMELIAIAAIKALQIQNRTVAILNLVKAGQNLASRRRGGTVGREKNKKRKKEKNRFLHFSSFYYLQTFAE